MSASSAASGSEPASPSSTPEDDRRGTGPPAKVTLTTYADCRDSIAVYDYDSAEEVTEDSPLTSTPLSSQPGNPDRRPPPPLLLDDGGLGVSARESTGQDTGFLEESRNSDDTCLQVPIIGYETMEQRARFTVFKLQVKRSESDSWFVFRRYTDFVQLCDKNALLHPTNWEVFCCTAYHAIWGHSCLSGSKGTHHLAVLDTCVQTVFDYFLLKVLFPAFHLTLPPKRWFGDNFDRMFLEERKEGLQELINKLLSDKLLRKSNPVREFFCFDDPPGPHDSLEESRALCESLEEVSYNLRKELKNKDSEIELLMAEVSLYKFQIEEMKKTFRLHKIIKDGDDGSLVPLAVAERPEVDQASFKSCKSNNSE